MGSPGPELRMELENLDKDADSKKSTIKALQSYVEKLNPEAIPTFLAQVSDTNQTGSSSVERTISLYEVLARVLGPKIVPQIGNIMSSIVKTLSSSAGAFAIHQACSKVVPAIARYAMDPTTDKSEKKYVIHSICKPLSDCLLIRQENLSSGAALCLQLLVESDNWRFSSNEMVNEVCQRVAGALEKYSQTNSHMALVTSLAKHNSMFVEAYVRIFIRCGLDILDSGYVEANSQKQLIAIHMVTSLMRYLDPKSIISELGLVIKEMEKCQFERMPYVTNAACEALKIAKQISVDKGSIFHRRENNKRNFSSSSRRNQSPLALPESQTFDNSAGYDRFNQSSTPMDRARRGMDHDSSRSVNRKLWQRFSNGGVDISLKDEIFSERSRRIDVLGSTYDEFSDNNEDSFQNSAGLVHGSGKYGFVRSNTPSPQRLNFHSEDVKIFCTPKKLTRSLKDFDHSNSAFSTEQSRRRFRSPMSTPDSKKNDHNGFCRKTNCSDIINNSKLCCGCEHFNCCSKSVSSTDDVFTCNNLQVSIQEIPNKSRLQNILQQKSALHIICAIFLVLFVVVLYLMETIDHDARGVLVPT